ncbi:hypothetical protein LCGC14_0621970 [marine sediment metagenome]|uniref:Uncharacterized protein n=1 Tax=marine sediment metagenome TaxID=412755 RepID=A0A0F9R4K2_9ZZZZ|nr:hypothetical protein [Pricia sp.]
MTKEHCCQLECKKDAEWEIFTNKPHSDAAVCTEHVGELLTDAQEHRIFRIINDTLCPKPKKQLTVEEIIKELIFREVHNHEVDITCSVHPAELPGLRELLKKNGKLYMGDV